MIDYGGDPYPIQEIKKYCKEKGVQVSYYMMEYTDNICYKFTFNGIYFGYMYGHDNNCHFRINWNEKEYEPTKSFIEKVLHFLHLKDKKYTISGQGLGAKLVKEYGIIRPNLPRDKWISEYITISDACYLIDKALEGFKIVKEEQIKKRLKELKEDFQ